MTSPRKPFIAANWKMNPAPQGFDAKDSPYRTKGTMDVVVFCAATDLHKVRDAELVYGAQYGHPEPKGAFTGDVSMPMLRDAGCRYVLCGHSERRKNHGESDAFVMEQVIAALEAGIHPVLCIGETENDPDHKKIHKILKAQLHGLPQSAEIVIAYEPSWAIGSGTPRTPEDVQEMHAFVRSLLPDSLKEGMRILYGASVSPENAAELLNQKDVDGLLIGGASLDPEKFRKIVDAAATTNA